MAPRTRKTSGRAKRGQATTPNAGVQKKKQSGRIAKANNPPTRSSNRLRGIPPPSSVAAAAVLPVAAPLLAAASPPPPFPLRVLNEAEKLEFHIKTSTNTMMHSDVISLFVHHGDGHEETFRIHIDLAILHSTALRDSFQDYQSENEEGVLETFEITDENPVDFSQFMSWMYTGRLLLPSINKFSFFEITCRGWALGSRFGAPAYQNFCLDQIRAYALHTSGLLPKAFPTALHAAEVYGLKLEFDEASKLRKFMVDSLEYVNHVDPDEDLAMMESWQEMMDDFPEFAEDLVRLGGEGDWDNTRPWDGELRGRYSVEEEELIVLTRRHIRTKHTVEQLMDMERDGSMYAEWALRVVFDEDDTTDAYGGND